MTELVSLNMDVANFKPTGIARPWLDHLRAAGLDRFRKVGYPSSKLEVWRHTNVSPIAKTKFRLARYRGTELTKHILAPYGFADEAACELVFVNGHFAAELSSLTGVPEGIVVRTFAQAIESDLPAFSDHLGRHARIEDNPFVALNTGFINDGVVIEAFSGAQIELPIHVMFVSTPSRDHACVSHPRVLLVAHDHVEMSLVETYCGVGEGVYFTNVVAEIVAGENCRIHHCKIQQEGLEAFHVATKQVRVGPKSDFISHSANLGARLTRNDLNVCLAGEGAAATLNGLGLIGGHQHLDNHTLVDHAYPNCPSHELYKYVLDDHASGVFRGKIHVAPHAQGTNSKQTSQALLISDDALMDSQPALEIYADDVKCTHGSTIGPLDDEALFYLRSRGISEQSARHLLTYAFLADITSRIKLEPVRRRLEEYMAAQHSLPKDLRIQKSTAHDEPVRK